MGDNMNKETGIKGIGDITIFTRSQWLYSSFYRVLSVLDIRRIQAIYHVSQSIALI